MTGIMHRTCQASQSSASKMMSLQTTANNHQNSWWSSNFGSKSWVSVPRRTSGLVFAAMPCKFKFIFDKLFCQCLHKPYLKPPMRSIFQVYSGLSTVFMWICSSFLRSNNPRQLANHFAIHTRLAQVDFSACLFCPNSWGMTYVRFQCPSGKI